MEPSPAHHPSDAAAAATPGAMTPSSSATSAVGKPAPTASTTSQSTGGSGGQYSPISTLERQYAPPVGRRIVVIVRANPACIVEGGVEAVLKASSSGGGGRGGQSVSVTAMADGPSGPANGQQQQQQQQEPVDLLRFDSSVSISSSQGDDGFANNSAYATIGDNAYASAEGQQQQQQQNGSGDDPFNFLGEATMSGTSAPSGSMRSSAVSASIRSSSSSGGGGGSKKLLGGISSKLARAARGAQDHIERGVTTMAIRADRNKAGRARRPDVLTVGAYVQTPFGELCVGMTEGMEIPDYSADGGQNGGAGGRKEAVTFAIPIVISPPANVSTGGPGSDVTVQFRLYIKSGATMLAKALQKRFVVGTGSVAVSALQSALSSASTPGGNSWKVGRCTVLLLGPALPPLPPTGPVPDGAAAAALDLFVAPDTKFPLLCGIGWTMTDPRVDTAYLGGGTTGGPLFNYPLEQNYCYPLSSGVGGGSSSGDVLVATERVNESSVVLPLAVACSKLFSDAASRSTNHASDVARSLRNNSLQFDDPMKAVEAGHAQCQVEVAHVLLGTPGSDPSAGANASGAGIGTSNRATVTVNLQRPDSIFESELGGASVPMYRHDAAASSYPTTAPALSVPFYPRVCSEDDPRLLPGLVAARASISSSSAGGGAAPHAAAAGKVYVGTVRVEVREEGVPNGGPNSVAYPASAMTLVAEDPNAFAPAEPRIMEAYVDIDPILNNPDGKYAQVPIYECKTGKVSGVVVMSLAAHTGTTTSSSMSARKPPPIAPARGGLVSLVGLDTLTEGMDCHPCLDYDADFPAAAPCPSGTASSPEDQAVLARRRRMATMGDFMSYSYVQYHLTSIRSVDMNRLTDRCNLYRDALNGKAAATAAGFEVPSNQRKDPRPFRPSSSRMDAPLAGLPFNVHVQTLSLTTISAAAGGGAAAASSRPVALFHNVTHGAPSDHARGFSGPPDQAAASVSGARGGLRRLEAARLTAAQRVRDAQNDLIQAVAQYFGSQSRSHPPPGDGSRRHVPVADAQIARLRRGVVDSIQSLHALTWDVAVRRAAVFSQALGIGVTSYLSHLSDAAKIGPSPGSGDGWPGVWKRHGFLITFEGLLSAAGKELGMIEDASVGVACLRMVTMVLVSDDGRQQQQRGVRVPVPQSPYLKFLCLIPSGVGSGTQYRLEIGLDPGYYAQRVPAPLRDGAAVRFYPLLFQMGVDIRQWGANAGMNVKNQMAGQQQFGRRDSMEEVGDAAAGGGEGGMIDDEDDDVGVADNDVLVALNLEAFRKMNAYSHTIMPATNAAMLPQTWEQANMQQPQQQQVAVHPAVAKLNDYIRSSAGKMEHGVLDEAANVAARLGGGAAIFCKSGKDRTAMQVTFKQAQFLNRYLSGERSDAVDDNGKVSPEKVFADATLMRIHGTRLPICEKNVGQAKFAFNSLQAKFMPEMLKPPPSTLAGFLKGGKVFSREGGIES